MHEALASESDKESTLAGALHEDAKRANKPARKQKN